MKVTVGLTSLALAMRRRLANISTYIWTRRKFIWDFDSCIIDVKNVQIKFF